MTAPGDVAAVCAKLSGALNDVPDDELVGVTRGLDGRGYRDLHHEHDALDFVRASDLRALLAAVEDGNKPQAPMAWAILAHESRDVLAVFRSEEKAHRRAQSYILRPDVIPLVAARRGATP